MTQILSDIGPTLQRADDVLARTANTSTIPRALRDLRAANAGEDNEMSELLSDNDSDDERAQPTDDDILNARRVTINTTFNERVMRAHRAQRNIQLAHAAQQHDMADAGEQILDIEPVIVNDELIFPAWIDIDFPAQAPETNEATINRILRDLTPPMVMQTTVTDHRRGPVPRRSMINARNTHLRHHVNALMRQSNPHDPRIVEPFSPTDRDDNASDLT